MNLCSDVFPMKESHIEQRCEVLWLALMSKLKGVPDTQKLVSSQADIHPIPSVALCRGYRDPPLSWR